MFRITAKALCLVVPADAAVVVILSSLSIPVRIPFSKGGLSGCSG